MLLCREQLYLAPNRTIARPSKTQGRATQAIPSSIHPGRANPTRSLGDRLVVGLNSNASVRLLKGPTRPIVPVEERREMLLALDSVDQVIVFDEPTPLLLIEALRPDVLVKGPDYAGRECCGATLVESYGGRVVIPNWPVIQSSTRIVERILAQGAAR
jgi:D-beta-D-heptose 7-phosphate kinase/D-beta-D-heptose 1-phosphate adenosyltransferase